MDKEADFKANKVMQEPLEKLYKYENDNNNKDNCLTNLDKMEEIIANQIKQMTVEQFYDLINIFSEARGYDENYPIDLDEIYTCDKCEIDHPDEGYYDPSNCYHTRCYKFFEEYCNKKI